MKKLSIALLAIALLLPAGMAQAYAIYNHVGHRVCVETFWWEFFTYKNCKFTIPPHSTHNGGHGDSLSEVWVSWDKGHNHCRTSDGNFSIPKGGYARIYDEKVKVYKHNGDHVKTLGIEKLDCK